MVKLFKSNYWFGSISILLALIYLVNGIIAIPRLSVTDDEADHLNYGIRFIKGYPEKVRPFDDASTMPISGLNAIPRALEQIIVRDLHKSDGGVSDIYNGRYITLLTCLLIGLFIFKWSSNLFGRASGLFSFTLFVFCPNLNGNAWLVTTDAYTALFVLITAYYFYRFIRYSGWGNFVLFSVFLGFSQAVKQSLILLPFFLGVFSLVILISRHTLFRHFRLHLLRLFTLISIVLLTINAAYLFQGSGTPLISYQFHSTFFKSLQRLPLLNRVFMPLPSPFLEGFDLVKYMLSLGSGHAETSPRSYLFGHYFTGKGPWYYYPIVILFKTPLSILFLIGLTAAKSVKSQLKLRYEIILPLALALLFVLSVMFLNTSQHGIRHLILIYPLLYVGFGGIIRDKLKIQKYLVPVLIIYCVCTFYYYFPNILSYTNELLWNKTEVYKTIASSNIDCGQCNKFIVNYLNEKKDIRRAPENPQTGKYILDINTYLDLRGTGKFAWLRKFSPESHINHCYLLFNITEQDIRQTNQQ